MFTLAVLLTFVQIADPQFGWYADPNFTIENKCLNEVISYVNNSKPDFLIVDGDMADSMPNSRRRRFQVTSLKETMSKVRVDTFYVSGNHDVGNKPTMKSIQQYRKDFGPDYYEINKNGVSFLVVNSSLLGQPQYAKQEAKLQWEWLEKSVKKSHPVAIFAHHPLFKKKYNEADGYFNWPQEKRKRMLNLLNGNTNWFISGHIHAPYEAKYNNITIFVAGSSAGPRLSSSAEIVRWIVMEDRKLVYERIKLKCLEK